MFAAVRSGNPHISQKPLLLASINFLVFSVNLPPGTTLLAVPLATAVLAEVRGLVPLDMPAHSHGVPVVVGRCPCVQVFDVHAQPVPALVEYPQVRVPVLLHPGQPVSTDLLSA